MQTPVSVDIGVEAPSKRYGCFHQKVLMFQMKGSDVSVERSIPF